MKEFKKIILKNKLPLLTIPMQESSSVGISLIIKAGSFHDSPGRSGTSHLLEHMLLRGTLHYPTQFELMSEIDKIGGILEAKTNQEMISLNLKIPKENLKRGLEILFGMAFHPALNPKQLEREKKVIMREIAAEAASHKNLVWKLFHQTVWPNGALGRNPLGTVKSVSKITRKDLLKHWGSFFIPSRAILAIAGNFDSRKAEVLVRKIFGKIPSTSGPINKKIQKKKSKNTPIIKIFQRNTPSPVVNFILGAKCAFGSANPQRFPLLVLNTALAGGFSSKLVRVLRTKMGLFYHLRPGTFLFSNCGYLAFHTATKEEDVRKIVFKTIEITKNIKQKSIGSAELDLAKRKRRARFVFALETPEKMAAWYAWQFLLAQRPFGYSEALKKINNVCQNDIKKLANQIFQPQNMVLVALGSCQKLLREKRGLEKILASI